MKTMLLVVAMVSAPAMASAIQDGAYKGSAQWKSSTQGAGTYEVTTTITGETLNSTYVFDGQTKTWNFTAKVNANSTFDVISDGQKVGDGYCLDVQCHYSAFNGNLEETLTFYGDNLYKLGSKSEDGAKIMWQEQLSKTAR